MTTPQSRFSIPSLVKDHHRRIRRLEASPGDGGGSGGGCPDCVLDPFTVNLNDITVPEIYRDCVDIGGALAAWGQVSGSGSSVQLATNIPIGICSAFDLGTPLKLQVMIDTSVGVTPSGTVENIKILIDGEAVFVKVNPIGQCSSGWIDADYECSGCTPMAMTVQFSETSFFGGVVGPGFAAARFVAVNDAGEFRGALDQIPQSEDGDVVHFNGDTHEWVTGPARRRTSYFMG